jgi:hypothetical protein
VTHELGLFLSCYETRGFAEGRNSPGFAVKAVFDLLVQLHDMHTAIDTVPTDIGQKHESEVAGLGAVPLTIQEHMFLGSSMNVNGLKRLRTSHAGLMRLTPRCRDKGIDSPSTQCDVPYLSSDRDCHMKVLKMPEPIHMP